MRTAEELRRLDVLAASRVLGISRDEWWESPEYGWNYLNEGRTLSGELRHYTTDPTACQSLKDKARADGWSYQITFLLDEVRAGVWKPPVSMDTYFDAVADSECVAVVLACVRAYGAEV